MIIGSRAVVVVNDEEVARGEVSIDAGLSLSLRLDELLGDLPAPGDEILLRMFEPVRGVSDYVVTVESSSPSMLIVGDIELISASQKRAIVRVSTDIPVMIIYEIVDNARLELEDSISARVVDLSAAGLRFFTATRVRDAFQFEFHFVSGVDDLTIVAETLRCHEVPRGYLYGCKFVGATEREMGALHRFVLSEQIAQRRRMQPV